MDSKNPRRLDQIAQSGQDDSATAMRSTLRRRPLLPEIIGAYPAPHYMPDVASSLTSQDAQTTPPDEAPLSLPDEQTVTVPILSAQYRAERWERVLDDDEITHQSPNDQSSVDDAHEPDELYTLDGKLFPHDDSLTLRDDPFALRERSLDGWNRFRKTSLALLALALMLAVAVAGAAVAATYAQQASQHLSIAPPRPTVGSYRSGVVIQPGPETTSPTPEAPKYQIGAWMSNNAPAGGTVKVFVRLSQDVAPIAQIPVTLAVQLPSGAVNYGPTNTDDYGLATFTVSFGGIAGTPIFVTASAKIGDQELTADTVFVPI